MLGGMLDPSDTSLKLSSSTVEHYTARLGLHVLSELGKPSSDLGGRPVDLG
ncbi:MAG: hypothetical protein ACRDRP_14595 [Pseudonocardiaceae bacterium]